MTTTNTHLGSESNVAKACRQYLASRQGSYEFRCQRYKGVADRLYNLRLWDWDAIADIGAGDGQFRHYMISSRRWKGNYFPVDGSIDGTNLEEWVPPQRYQFMVAIEVLEHLHNYERMMDIMERFSIFGAVATVPNPEVVDVLGCDPTHVSVIPQVTFVERGWSVTCESFFGVPKDTIVAWIGGGAL